MIERKQESEAGTNFFIHIEIKKINVANRKYRKMKNEKR